MPKYPLEPLAELRQKKVDEATAALAEAVGRHDAASSALRGAEFRRDAAAHAAANVRTAELDALARGDLRVRDLAQEHVWAARAAREQESLEAVVRRAAETEATARDRQNDAQQALGMRSADARVVEGHRDRWNEANRRGVEAREEEAWSEAWRQRR
jgi:hypothetical protein